MITSVNTYKTYLLNCIQKKLTFTGMKTIIIASLLVCSLQFSGQESKVLININTEIGNIMLELYPEVAPITVANFLKYVDAGHFAGGSFYRSVAMENQLDNDIKIEVIQGGLAGSGKQSGIEPVEHETTEVSGLKHLDGTISMARSRPGTASSEFFICINDQPSLDYGGMRNPDGQGFAAFGKVIEGMDVVRKIQKSNAEGQNLKPKIKILDIKRK